MSEDVPTSDLALTEPRSRGSWLRVADLMGCKPELAALRKLQKFNVLRLLEMQAQLVQQGEDYEYYCSLDAKAHCPITQTYSTNWEALDEAQGLSGSLQRDAWRKLLADVPKNNALLQHIEISKLDGPSKHDLSLLRNWLGRATGNDCSLRGPGSDVWKVGEGRFRNTENDFLVLSSKHCNRDLFERWIGDTLLRVYHRFVGERLKKNHIKDEELGLTEYDDLKISVAASILCTLFAPLLTTIPMFVLYFVSDIRTRLGIIMGFTTLFSISLALFSSARRIEVFAATCAFAAVQVVYGTVNQ
ncbi:hypothetical protein BDR22DRAFT_886215 [Usnea florida]